MNLHVTENYHFCIYGISTTFLVGKKMTASFYSPFFLFPSSFFFFFPNIKLFANLMTGKKNKEKNLSFKNNTVCITHLQTG